ncbi:MAG TPA: hypothetical protein VIV11_11615 [Kofleriaceae bacterium]
MRWATLALLAGCNTILGIREIPVDGLGVDADPCVGTCECRDDADCPGAHRVCNDQVITRSCSCAAGYEPQSGVCTWSGVVGDPEIAQPGAWVTSGDASLVAAPLGLGMLDPGYALITRGTTCVPMAGAIAQNVTMPRLSVAEPLVAEINLYAEGRNGGGNNDDTNIGVAVGAVWTSNVFDNSYWQTYRQCLGESQYAPESSKGRGVSIQIDGAADSVNSRCDAAAYFDHILVVPANAGECPMPGAALNGDAEGTGGWYFPPALVSGGSAAFEAGCGEQTSRCVKLTSRQRCDYVYADDLVSVPARTETGSPSLSIFHARNTTTSSFGVMIDTLPLDLSSSTQPTTERYCLPAYMAGGVYKLRAWLYPGTAGVCTDAVNVTASVDAVRVQNDPACGTNEAIADPGFESSYSLLGAAATSGSTVATGLDSVHGGGMGRVLLMTNGRTCEYGRYTAEVTTRTAPAGTGPALSFWYRLPGGTNSAFTVTSHKGTFTPTRGGWAQGLVCLDPKVAVGRPQPVMFQLYLSNATCGTAVSGETLALDDLEATFAAACAP